MSQWLGKRSPQRTLSELRLIQRKHQEHPEIAEIEQAIHYLERREVMIDYPHFRQKQIPIGSGIVESGHKVVNQRRMKQAGMRWAEENLNPMFVLRMAICNRPWSSQWQTIQAYVQHKRSQHRKNRVQSPVKLNSSGVVTEADNQRLIKLTVSSQ